ncbi:glutamate 5-kinase [Amphibacillus marinus]|uniref:Glutamate 5-kinase n=1 Tax=Amphibacillus marinus TaxID=872970 RepID=A0A1H8GTB4_9BACI|nr:glutamate 5-kinase [Amphibacillus marinus]SEN47282.1 glutamate 5-kinase [Amphibacillus marinus]
METKRVVIKIGSSSLTNKDGTLSLKKLQQYSEAVSSLMDQGIEVVLISSGAVSAGFRDLGYSSRPVTVSGKQAAAAVGQGLLIKAYNDFFKKLGYVSAQLLLTRDVFRNEIQFSNVYQTIRELLKRRVIPIINENDSVATDELTFGDNDMLSALVSGLVNADLLIILTDIDGIYRENPRTHPMSAKIDYLPHISDALINQMSAESGSKVGTGGMKSKLLAAQKATSLGVRCFIGLAEQQEALRLVIKGNGTGSYIGSEEAVHVRKQKQWIAFHSQVSGRVFIDDGAKQAIELEGKSLLPIGIVALEGEFNKDDVVEIYYHHQLLAKGQINYSNGQLQQIRGLNSHEASKLIKGTKAEAIHRNKLILTTQGV